jgi:PAS domain-containing protein
MTGQETSHPRTRFFVRVILPGILAFLLFAGLIIGYLIPMFERAMMDRKKETSRELTNSAWSILEHYNRAVSSGELTQPEAMELARDAVKELRYGEEAKDYFWITDRQPVMIVHPYRPDLDGQDLTDFRDPEGKALFVEFVKVTTEAGEGYVDYRWQWKDDSVRIVPKLSYVRLFKPWGWIIGTGIYVEDVRTEIRRMERRAILISGGIGMLIMILLVIITRQSHRIELKRRRAERELFESRERYKALAEVASEGVLIWSEQGIHANKTLLAWLGYQEEELEGTSLHQLVPDAGLHRFEKPGTLYRELTSRIIAECSLVAKDRTLKRVHADLSRILINGEESVMLVARPLQVSHDPGTIAFAERLMNRVGIGFFRTTLTRHARLTSANESLLRLLGYNSFQELADLPSHTFFQDAAEYRLFRALITESGEVADLPVLFRRRDGQSVRVILNALVRDDLPDQKWLEGTIEVLSVNHARELIPAGGISDLNLAARAGSGRLPTLTGLEELLDAWNGMPDHIVGRIGTASTEEELSNEYLTSTRLAGSLIEAGADPVTVVRFLSLVGDAICKRLVELILVVSGPPPARFAVIQLGSAGRGEQTLATDQDNALVFEDVPDDQLETARAWFLEFGKQLNERLAIAGYRKCTGNVMAGNPRWCQPLSQWKTYFSKWTRNPGPDELLEMSIFFDFRHASGDEVLVDALRAYVQAELHTNDIYFHHMTTAWKPFAPGRQSPSGPAVNLKRLLMPLTGIVRLYGMRHDARDSSTFEKCASLYKKGVFSRELFTGTTEAWKLLMKLRLTSQHGALLSGTEPDNLLDPILFGEELKYLLEKAIQQIDDLMLKASNDFHAHDGLGA